MTIEEIQNQIIEEFSVFTDWMDKYGYIIEMGKDIPDMDKSLKTKQNLIQGCQSQVWLHADYIDGKIFFKTDSDAILTKGLAYMLVKAYSGHSPDEIINTDPFLIEKLDLTHHLSPTRSNGLSSMVKQIKLYAIAYKAKNEQK